MIHFSYFTELEVEEENKALKEALVPSGWRVEISEVHTNEDDSFPIPSS